MSATDPLDTRAGAAVYSPFVLKLYDAYVLGFSNRCAWRCPTGRVLLPFYRENLGKRHLDVGVGTGYYLAHAGFVADQQVALLDLNPTSLRTAAQRMGRPHSGLFATDVMQPLALPGAPVFDSIALYYLLHCLPGSMAEKARVFAHLKPYLAADGVLYGATILGDGAGHNPLGRKLMEDGNGPGISGKAADTLKQLRAALGEHFAQVSVRQHGVVALFSARA